MNNISALWQGIDQLLLEKKDEIGIVSVEQAETGTVNAAKAPAALTWIDFDEANFAAGGVIVSLPVSLYVFCLAAPERNQAKAVNAALDIAINVVKALSQMEVCGSIILPDAKPLELIKKTSTDAIVAAMFTIDVEI